MTSTSRERTYRTRAVILRRRDVGDADRVLTVFTPALGKQMLIAKGVRKTTSRKAGHVELFTHATLLVARARTWDIITEAGTVENFRHLRQDLDGIGYANYVCELVEAFSEEDDENSLLWDLCLMALRQLDLAAGAEQQLDPAVLMRWFELHLLSVTGFQPELFHCLSCSEALEERRNFLLLHEGGVVCPNCRPRLGEVEPLEPEVLKVLRFLQSRSWEAVGQLQIRPHIQQSAQNILYRYLLIILERQVRSSDFLRRLERARAD